MSWLLDTNAVIHAIRGNPASVRERLEDAGPNQLRVSAITVGELWYGAEKSNRPDRRTLFETFLEPFEILSFDEEAGTEHGRLRHALRRSPIGERDLFIAAIARANDLTVVTANVREFERVPGLAVEDWTQG